ncbi:acyl-CoA dehydrogenase family protein [Chloroflexota bacterium]
MDFSFTEQQEMLRTMARDFGEKEFPKSLVREMEKDDRGITEELWRKIAELGWMELIFPEEYGGLGASFLDFLVLMEEIGRACLPGLFFADVMLGGLIVLAAGNEEQKQAILPELAKGKLIATLALIEPDGGYEPSAITTEAVHDNNGYLISGTKLFVPFAHIANRIVCIARSNEGVTLFLVDAKNQGIKTTPLGTISGDKQSEVVFDNVKVSAGDVLGEPGKGWDALEPVLAKAKVAKCAEMVGMAQRMLEMSVDYAKQRIQFDRPIGSFQVIQQYCANMLTDVETSKYLTYKAAWMLDEGIPCTREVAIAKGWTSSACRRVAALAHQIHGAMGFSADHDLGFYYKRLKESELLFGDEEVHKEILAQEMGL